jgi:23S rRNA pseudouridine2457 synthase
MHRYLLFYKPYGVLTQFTDRSAAPRPTLKDFIPVPGVYPVGRLDQDSEGLLLLTSDGALQHRWTDPKFDHPKTYWVQVEGDPGEEALKQFASGLRLPDGLTKPARVRRLPADPDLPPRDPPIRFRKSIPTCWIELILTEGRNRQVRRMTAAAGFPTLRLVRVAIGNMRLDGLKPGEWKEIARADVK